VSAERTYIPNKPGIRYRKSERSRSGTPHASVVAANYPASATPGAGLAVGFKVDIKALMKTLAKMSDDARSKLEAKAIRQSLGPFYRNMRKQWKGLSVGKPSQKRVRYWTARAVKMHVDRYRVSGVGAKGRRERYGKVYISYKYRYRSARMAHLLENPRGNYRTSGPMKGKERQSSTRKFGYMGRSYRVNHKVFQRMKAGSQRAFEIATSLFLAGYQTKQVRKTIKGMYG